MHQVALVSPTESRGVGANHWLVLRGAWHTRRVGLSRTNWLAASGALWAPVSCAEGASFSDLATFHDSMSRRGDVEEKRWSFQLRYISECEKWFPNSAWNRSCGERGLSFKAYSEEKVGKSQRVGSQGTWSLVPLLRFLLGDSRFGSIAGPALLEPARRWRGLRGPCAGRGYGRDGHGGIGVLYIPPCFQHTRLDSAVRSAP